MKRFIKAMSMIIVFMLVINVFTLPVLAENAENEPVISVEGISGEYKAGDKIPVTIKLLNNPGITMFAFTIKYNPAELDCVCTLANGWTLTGPTPEAGNMKIMAYSNTAVSSELLADINFTIKSDVSAGSVQFNIPYIEVVKGSSEINLQQSSFNGLFTIKSSGGSSVTPPNSPLGGYSQDDETTSTTMGNDDDDTTPIIPNIRSKTAAIDNETAAIGDNTNLPLTRWVNPFSDVNTADWFYADVEYVNSSAPMLMNGMSANVFGVNVPVTRGMVVTVLGRYYGVDTGKYMTATFDDVDMKEYYAPYIAWAQESKIVLGVGGNRFEPNAPVTRQDLAVIFARCTDFAGKKLAEIRKPILFTDIDKFSSYSISAVQMLYGAGVINGMTADTYEPRGIAARVHFAAMLHRFIKAVTA